MEEKISKEVWTRAKAIFEAEGRKDVAWGQATHNGEQAFHFTERESPDSPTVAAMTPDMRKVYLDRATAELKAEGKL